MDTLRNAETIRSDVKQTLRSRDDVADFRLLNVETEVQGIIDLYAEQVGNLHAGHDTVETLHDNLTVTDCGEPVDQRKLGGPFLGTSSSETYDKRVYRYEIRVSLDDD